MIYFIVKCTIVQYIPYTIYDVFDIVPGPEHLLCVGVAHEGAQEGGAKGCHRNQVSAQEQAIKCGQVLWASFWFGVSFAGRRAERRWWGTEESFDPPEGVEAPWRSPRYTIKHGIKRGILTLKCYQGQYNQFCQIKQHFGK